MHNFTQIYFKSSLKFDTPFKSESLWVCHNTSNLKILFSQNQIKIQAYVFTSKQELGKQSLALSNTISNLKWEVQTTFSDSLYLYSDSVSVLEKMSWLDFKEKRKNIVYRNFGYVRFSMIHSYNKKYSPKYYAHICCVIYQISS